MMKNTISAPKVMQTDKTLKLIYIDENDKSNSSDGPQESNGKVESFYDENIMRNFKTEYTKSI